MCDFFSFAYCYVHKVKRISIEPVERVAQSAEKYIDTRSIDYRQAIHEKKGQQHIIIHLAFDILICVPASPFNQLVV